MKCHFLNEIPSGKSWIGGDLNVGQVSLGMAKCFLEGKIRILAFGGKSEYCRHPFNLDSIEVWDEKTESWSVSTLRLKQKISNFGYVSVPFKEFS